jgi:hypothetical protein
MISVAVKYGSWGSYNDPETNERKIELPLGFWFLDAYDKVVEIGEVTASYKEPKHPVYDLSSDNLARRVDLFNVDIKGKDVLCISTVEHVGFGDYGNPAEPHKAIKAVQYIMENARSYLITFPVGYNRELEADLAESGIRYFLMERDDRNNWRMCHHKDMNKFEYNSPYGYGNAICIIHDLLDAVRIEE